MENKKPMPKSDVPPKNHDQRDVNDVPEKPNAPVEPRRYDEADPSWRNPDVQMRPGENPNVNTSKGI